MGKPRAPKAPPWDELLEFAETQAAMNNEVTQEFLSIHRDTSAAQEQRASEFWDTQRPAMEESMDFSREQRQRYREMGIPLEDALARDLQDWGSEDRTRARASEAAADVSNAFQQERAALASRLTGMGVDPSQVMSNGLAARLGVQEAATKAAAVTQSRRQSEAEALSMRGDAANLYRGIEASGAQQAQLGGQAGQAGIQAGAQAQQGTTQGYGTAGQMIAQGGQMMSGAFGAAGNIYGNQVRAYETQMANSPAAVAGGLIGTALPFLFNEGGYVDPSMSPSRGALPDDVPARVSAGELVMPPETVAYHGIKTFNKLNEETARALGGAQKGALPA